MRLEDSLMLLGAVAGLRSEAPRVALETVALIADRFRVDAVARSAQRHL